MNDIDRHVRLVLTSAAPATGMPGQNSRSSSKSTSSQQGMVFFLNGTSAPISGPFAVTSAHTGCSPPGRACAILDWHEEGLAESNAGQAR